MLTKPGDLTGSVITRGSVTFTEVERRGGTRLYFAPREPLGYAIINSDGTMIARAAGYTVASWILEAIEKKDNE